MTHSTIIPETIEENNADKETLSEGENWQNSVKMAAKPPRPLVTALGKLYIRYSKVIISIAKCYIAFVYSLKSNLNV